MLRSRRTRFVLSPQAAIGRFFWLTREIYFDIVAPCWHNNACLRGCLSCASDLRCCWVVRQA